MIKKYLIVGGILLLAGAALPFLIKTAKIKEGDNELEPHEKYQCKALTTSGKRCSRLSLPESDYCWQHENSNTST